MSQITSQATVSRLKRLFASYGLPEQIVTDNANNFTSEEFQTFDKQKGILHTSALGHPATNGQAERYVQTFKTGMKKLANTTMNVDRICLFLLQYQTAPNCTMGQSPTVLFLHRHVRTRLDFLKPCTKETVCKKQYQQKDHHDSSAADQSFSVDDTVYLRSTVGRDHRWISGLLVRQTYGDQLRACATAESGTVVIDSQVDQFGDKDCGGFQGIVDSIQSSQPPKPETVALKRSTRVSKPPKRYMH